jgi:dCTP deaminase
MLVSGRTLVELARQDLVKPDPAVVEPVAIPLHLDNQFLRYEPAEEPLVPPSPVPVRTVPLDADGQLVLEPGESVLACTYEIVEIPLHVMGFIQTKGGVARSFLAQLTDGQVDPGYRGKITLELVNFGPVRLALRPMMPIANLYILSLSEPVEPYNGRYQDSHAPSPMVPSGSADGAGVG